MDMSFLRQLACVCLLQATILLLETHNVMPARQAPLRLPLHRLAVQHALQVTTKMKRAKTPATPALLVPTIRS
jgi:hypothetical protein